MDESQQPPVTPVPPPGSAAASAKAMGSGGARNAASSSKSKKEPPDPVTIGAWLASNAMPLVFLSAIVGLVIYRGLSVPDLLKTVAGLGLVIFIHELGHFLAAKWCDVHVETFSIGFGKPLPLPFCRWKYGETTYKLGWIPLGGYVKMVGEGDNADTEEAEEDPRSFKNKPVWQRMIIISAGVIMNLILGCICFMVAYTHGVEETSPIVGSVNVGSPAWYEDIRGDEQIIQIESNGKPSFDDIKPTVMSASKGERIYFKFRDRAGKEREVMMEPRRFPDELYPVVGVRPLEQLVLSGINKGTLKAFRKDTPAASATGSDGSGFLPGDRIIATSSDPNDPTKLTELPLDDRDPTGNKYDFFEYHRRSFLLRAHPFRVKVERAKGGTAELTVPVAPTMVLPGVRFQIGRVAGVRKNSPAAAAANSTDGAIQSVDINYPDSGDKLIAIEVAEANGKRTRWVEEFSKDTDKEKTKDAVTEMLFDPLRLPHELETWAEKATDLRMKLTFLREPDAGERKGRRVSYEMTWNPALATAGDSMGSANTPTAISGLGLAYFVESTVDSVASGSATASAGLQKGDVITAMRIRELDEKGVPGAFREIPIKSSQGAFLFGNLHYLTVPDFELKVKRVGTSGDSEAVIAVRTEPDATWPSVDRGLRFTIDSRVQKADGILDSLRMGAFRTLRTVKVIYQTLYATIFGQISVKTMSGPLSIANVSYKIAGYDIWQFIVFIGLININLAVVNFLPIPVLDGGHMCFLIYEKIFRRPPPDKLVEWSLYAGLAMILTLMAFVIYLDVKRLFLS